MKYYFLDFEMLSSPKRIDNGVPIAIGIVSLEGDYSFKSIINPQKKKLEVHNHTVSLTGITRQDLLKAPNFEYIYKEMKKKIDFYHSVFIVWGNFDEILWNNACQKYALENHCHFFDFQEYVGVETKVNRRLGLQVMKDILAIQKPFKEHDPHSDAKLLREIYQKIKSNEKEAKSLIRKYCYEKDLTTLNNKYADVLLQLQKVGK